ncbi:N-(5'-phosphoribosyl)anthranilate isomerase [Yoonia maritima]|uniref:N-(5'-phosphoribosyl)anthranilate isomerase n=1 Tax=Yoonia maritima TaxID=1435347 RepID=UPI000D113627|nr:N-(5'-phosphoribosyl)anthranilate isomerase [Yoonia maritima]
MRYHRRDGRDWLAQIFQCRAAIIGGVIRRQIIDVEREIGTDALIAEVKRRGFRMIRTNNYYVIICNDGAIELIC